MATIEGTVLGLGLSGVLVTLFLVWTGLAVWVVFLDGAEWIEESWLGGILFGLLYEVSPDFPPCAIKWFVGCVWFLTVVGFIVALFVG